MADLPYYALGGKCPECDTPTMSEVTGDGDLQTVCPLCDRVVSFTTAPPRGNARGGPPQNINNRRDKS